MAIFLGALVTGLGAVTFVLGAMLLWYGVSQ